MQVFCSKCKGRTNHEILKEEVRELNDFEEHWWEEHRYQIISCSGCGEVTFRMLYNDIQRQQTADYYDMEDAYRETLYPHRSHFTRTPSTTTNYPSNIKSIYSESILAYNSEQYILCAGGLRALIEGIFLNKELLETATITKKGKTLYHKIEALREKGFLTNNNASALHELRFLGNEALHELNIPEREDLTIAIDI